MNKKIIVKLTGHAIIKAKEMKIDLNDIKMAVLNPWFVESDKIDNSLMHYIHKMNDRFLRIIGKWENEVVFLVISAFFDRRLKRREIRDKNNL